MDFKSCREVKVESDETKGKVSGNGQASAFWCRASFGPSNEAKYLGRASLNVPSPNVEYSMRVPHLDKERSRSRF